MPRRKNGKTAGVTPISRAELVRLRKELARVLSVVESNADELAALRRESTVSLRRCAELQLEIDRIKKQLAIA